MNLKPIGVFHSNKKNPYEAARQPAVDGTLSEGYILLHPGQNFEQALIGLDSFSHIWVLFEFDRNQNWKPMVLPPRGTNQKVGVFATRAPYRPNPIGMSSVQLLKIEGLKVHVSGHDILDQTPILDLKPYLPYSDSIHGANTGWLKENPFQIDIQPLAKAQLEFLEKNGITELRPFLLQQLSHEPIDSRRKRVRSLSGNQYEIAYRTWRIRFELHHVPADRIQIMEISSGYSKKDLSLDEDPYLDKALHRNFHIEM